jgi:hypothetical protein
MSHTFNGGSRNGVPKVRAKRFSCIFARDSAATELLHGCPVVTGAGESIGSVKSILVDSKTRQLRYVMTSSGKGDASVALPWHALYFDSVLARLVFYTYS